MKLLASRELGRRSLGGIATTVGFLLSPFSWWNDLFVNLPLALGFAWVLSWFYPPAFGVLIVVGYWLTNVLGLVLMHRGGMIALGKTDHPYGRRELIKDLWIALLYTALIAVLLAFKVFEPLPEGVRWPWSSGLGALALRAQALA